MPAEIPAKRFRYGLQPLLRKRSAELDLAREALAAAALQLDARKRELEMQSARFAELQDYQRGHSGQGAPIDVEARLRLYDCLRSADAQRQEHAAQLDAARERHEVVIDQVRVARQALKALERHRENSQQLYKVAEHRRSQGASDELHLAGRQAIAAAAPLKIGSQT